MCKQAIPKVPQLSGKRKKMAGKKKEKASPSIATLTRSISEAESDTPTLPVKKKRSELQDTTTADTACFKEALKVKMLGRSSEYTTPPPPLFSKYRVKKKSTL